MLRPGAYCSGKPHGGSGGWAGCTQPRQRLPGVNTQLLLNRRLAAAEAARLERVSLRGWACAAEGRAGCASLLK